MALPALNPRRGSRNSAPAPAHHPPRAASSLAPPISHTRHEGAGGVGGVSLGGVVGMVGGGRRGSTGNLLPEDHPTDDGGSTDNNGGGGEPSVINEEDYIALQLEVARLKEVRDEESCAPACTFFQKRFSLQPLGRRSCGSLVSARPPATEGSGRASS